MAQRIALLLGFAMIGIGVPATANAQFRFNAGNVRFNDQSNRVILTNLPGTLTGKIYLDTSYGAPAGGIIKVSLIKRDGTTHGPLLSIPKWKTLQTKSIQISNSTGPWRYQFNGVPANADIRVVAVYHGSWNPRGGGTSGGSGTFQMLAGKVKTVNVTMKPILLH